MEWNSENYDHQHGFVAKYGENLLRFLPENAKTVLDIGCGTGILTQEIAALGYTVKGIDASETMIATARKNFPTVDFSQTDILKFSSEKEYDLLFSNAAFHWITQQDQLLQVCHRLLKVGGLLICEFGAKDNIAQIQAAFSQALKSLGKDYQSPFFFPSDKKYAQLLEAAGFEVLHLVSYDRPTPLKGKRRTEKLAAAVLCPRAG